MRPRYARVIFNKERERNQVHFNTWIHRKCNKNFNPFICYNQNKRWGNTRNCSFFLFFLPSQTPEIFFCKRTTNKKCLSIVLHIYPTPPLGQDMTQGQFFKRSLTGLNSEFSFSYTSCFTKVEEPSLSCYLPIAGGRIIGFIPFPRVLVLCEIQSVSSRIWTHVAVFISNNDKHYTTGTSFQ